MEKRNSKKCEESYDCKNWRQTYQYSESHEVPEYWCCSMLTLGNGMKQKCTDPEKEIPEEYLDFSPGSIVWAKLEGYPWWPGMVDGEPESSEYYWRRANDTLWYNVTFLDEKPTHAWISEFTICPFLKPPMVTKNFKEIKYAKAISEAKERAKEAMKMTIKERLKTYSFVHVYKGRWTETNDTNKNLAGNSTHAIQPPPKAKALENENELDSNINMPIKRRKKGKRSI